MSDSAIKLILDFFLGILIMTSVFYALYKYLSINKGINEKEPNTTDQANKIEQIPEPNNNWNECYQPQYLMTSNEKAQFKKIMNWTKGKGMYVFTKVRLADLIKPRVHNQKLFWKIQAKHLDFILCDENIRVKLVIELQDNSHNQPERKERDEFVKQVLESCGYKIIQVKYISNEILDKAFGINEQLSISETNTQNP